MTAEAGLVEQARALAADLLFPLGDRWLHVQGVAARAGELARRVPVADRELLMAAAWLHDVGYAPTVVRTGLHQLDGAQFLEDVGFPARLVGLVAHHSEARFEADERGLRAALDRYPVEDGPVRDVLTAADMTTGPSGKRVEFHARIEEILTRYPEGSAVHRAISRARPYLARAVERASVR